MFWLLGQRHLSLRRARHLAEGAWHSIDRTSRQQWYLGGVLRSLHRYAADAFVLLMGRTRCANGCSATGRPRRFSWLTGVPLLLFAFVSAIGGFWLNWDQLGAGSPPSPPPSGSMRCRCWPRR